MSIESKVYLDIARIWNLGPGEVEKMVRDYIGAVTCDFKPLQTYPKPHIKPVKVKSLKERLEEATMHADCEDCIKRDICTKDVPKPCKYRYTEDDRRADQASDMFGAILHKTYLHPTFRKKKEDNKMKSTSTENFKDIVAITFELQTFPDPDVQDKFIVTATNRDDIFEFNFEGPHLIDVCRNAGLFGGWEKDQRIKELEKELSDWKKEAAECLKLRDEAQKEAYKLKKEYEMLKDRHTLTKATNENFADEKPSDNVNHPSHYTGRYECIDVMQDVFGNEATDNFCLCNAFKYIWRARKKNGLEDVKKAVWYLNKYIEEAEKDGVSKGERV